MCRIARWIPRAPLSGPAAGQQRQREDGCDEYDQRSFSHVGSNSGFQDFAQADKDMAGRYPGRSRSGQPNVPWRGPQYDSTTLTALSSTKQAL